MKKTLPITVEVKNPLMAQAEQAVLQKLPVDQKTIQRAAKLLEPKNLKRIGIAAIGGSVLISALLNLGHDRIYRAAVSAELKKQLAPVQRKLDELEAQNAALYQQNLELQEKLSKLES